MSSDKSFESSVGIKYPSHRDDFVVTTEKWLEDKRTDDGAEGLWRIHDEIYDLSTWIDNHPGGPDWLKWTKGTDITEAFETHHLSTLAEEILPKFYVKKAKTARNYSYTFHENGFYRTLKKQVRQTIKNTSNTPKLKSKITTDMLLFGFFVSALLANIFYNFVIGAVSGVFLAMTTIAAHNFFHQRDNWRMYYFDFSLMSSRHWRISHVLSHHLYTNTVSDLELSVLEPFLQYLPREKGILQRTISFIISPGVWAFIFLAESLRRLTAPKSCENSIPLNRVDFLPFMIPLAMYIVAGNLLNSFLMWFWIISIGSFHFGLVGLNAAHHHPSIFHDGDTRREDHDWGMMQLDSVMDRREINKFRFLVLTNFGDHGLHHLFPTIDHSLLPLLYPALKSTCQQFNVQLRVVSQLELIYGQFLQLFRVRPNPITPGKKTQKKTNKKKTYAQLFKPYINIEKKVIAN